MSLYDALKDPDSLSGDAILGAAGGATAAGAGVLGTQLEKLLLDQALKKNSTAGLAVAADTVAKQADNIVKAMSRNPTVAAAAAKALQSGPARKVLYDALFTSKQVLPGITEGAGNIPRYLATGARGAAVAVPLLLSAMLIRKKHKGELR